MKKRDLLEIQESILRFSAKQTDEAADVLKALVWAAVDMAEIHILQLKERLGDQPALLVGHTMFSRREVESLDPEQVLRSYVELGIEIRRKSREAEGAS